MTNFNDILNKQASEIEAPKLKPVGLYRARVEKHDPKEVEVKNGPKAGTKMHLVDVLFKLVEPLDVPDGVEGIDIAQGVVKKTFFLDDGGDFYFREFMEKHCGIASSGVTLGEMLSELNGKECAVVVEHTKPDATGRQYAQVGNTKAL